MSGELGTMSVQFTASTSGLESGIERAKSSIGGFASMGGGLLAGIGGGLLMLGKAALGFGEQSVKSGANFQESMGKVSAYAGLTKSQTDSLGNSIMGLATQMGQSPKAMADALYPIISSGYSAAQSLDILKLSAETAAASGADMSVIADALTTSLKAMGAPASDAGQYMDDINKIVALGKGQVSDYAAIIGKLSLSAKSANVPFGDMGAALADLTTHGFPSVAQASTALGNLFTQIGPKVDNVAAHAKKLGLAFDENKFKTDNLSQKLAYLKQITGDNQGEMLKLVGGNTLALKAFNAMEGSTGDLAANMKAMGNATGTTAQVFQKTHDDWNNSVKRLSATYEVIKDKVGLFLIGALTPMLNAITPLIGKFSDWMTAGNGLGGVFNTLGQIFQPLVDTIQSFDWGGITYGFKQIGDAIGSIFSPVSSLSGAFKGLDIKGIGQAIQIGFLQVMFKVADVLRWVADGIRLLKPVFDQVGAIIGGVFSAHMKTATDAIQSLAGWFQTGLMPAIQQAMPGFQALADTLLNVVVPALAQLWAAGQSIVDNVVPPLITAFETAAPVFIRIAGIIDGGIAAALRFLVPFAVQAGQAIADFASGIAIRVLPIVDNFFNGISQALDWLTPIWNAAWPAISNTLVGSWDVIVGAVQGAWAVVTGVINVGLDVISGNWGRAWVDIANIFIGIWNGIVGILGGFLKMAGIDIGNFGKAATLSFDDTNKKASQSMSTMSNNVNNSTKSMQTQSYTNVTSFSQDTMDMFKKMGDYGTKQMQSLDQNTIGYWNDIAAYITGHPINAVVHTLVSGSGKQLSLGMQKNAYASGVMNAPAGWAMVGEQGPELMKLHGGENIYPNSSLSASPFAALNSQHNSQALTGGSAGSGGGNSGPVEITVMLDSKQIGHATAPHIVQRMRVLTQQRN